MPGSSGGGGGLSDFAAVKGGVKFAAGQLIKNPTLIDKFSRLLAGAGRSGAVDDLVSLGRKLRIESGLALGAKVVAGGAGGRRGAVSARGRLVLLHTGSAIAGS